MAGRWPGDHRDNAGAREAAARLVDFDGTICDDVEFVRLVAFSEHDAATLVGGEGHERGEGHPPRGDERAKKRQPLEHVCDDHVAQLGPLRRRLQRSGHLGPPPRLALGVDHPALEHEHAARAQGGDGVLA